MYNETKEKEKTIFYSPIGTDMFYIAQLSFTNDRRGREGINKLQHLLGILAITRGPIPRD